MSLEDTIRGLTEAVTALTQTLQANREALLSIPAVPAVPAGQTGTPAGQTGTPAVPAVPAGIPGNSEPPAEAAPDYATVAKAITEIFPKDRERVLAALKKFGAAKGPQLKPEDYAAFLAELA